MARTYSFAEVQQHRAAADCWVILYGHVYDVTNFLPEHPGGSKIILQLAGQDATEAYDPVHPPGTLESSLPPECKLGPVDTSTLPKPSADEESQGKKETHPAVMHVQECLNLDEIEQVATQKLSQRAWAYYFSASDDLWSKSYNNTAYKSILLRPRIFVDVSKCDTSTSILGYKVSAPFFVSPAAQARLAHPEGERGIAKACAKHGLCQIISHNASMSPEQICEGADPNQVFGWQLYVQNDRKKSEAMLQRIKKIPCIKFLVLTLDAPVPGKRELDERQGSVGAALPASSSVAAQQKRPEVPHQGSNQSNDEKSGVEPPKPGGGGVGRSMFAGTAADLNWKATMPWLEKHTDLPIVLKGVQTHEDVYRASLNPRIKGVILSNHGGRAMDTASPSIHTLLEINKYCPEVHKKLEIYLDGGIKRGTDVVKALALGARAVGLGRSALYGLGAGGIEGVERVFEILKAEIDTTMRLGGATTVDELGKHHVNTRKAEQEIYDGPLGFSKVGLWLKSKL
ncbi:putative mitochondrial cytochrome b2 [Cystobasidium minutum MCA 4210]|uniref:putative mitochondrial cytochrome b2 n=1 Tax=Cystobasidium minutum MCA 4210 TaxID=1397322 RepID=UPI0034CF60E6|eukprot:jgi/Rhomi1/184945/estExt_fgenesh1_pm.C_10283